MVQTKTRLQAGAPIAREPELHVAWTTTNGFWVLNKSSESKTLGAGELFGFNIGSWVEIASGQNIGLKLCIFLTPSLKNIVRKTQHEMISLETELKLNLKWIKKVMKIETQSFLNSAPKIYDPCSHRKLHA